MSEEVRVPYYEGWGYREGRIGRVLDELRTHNEVKGKRQLIGVF